MNCKIVSTLVTAVVFTACVTIPKETVVLSKTLSNDLVILHNSHRNSVEIYYNKVKRDINIFVDEVFSPYIINFVLKVELENYQAGDSSIFKSIEIAAKQRGLKESESALNDMIEVVTLTKYHIDSMRTVMLAPVLEQEKRIIKSIDQSYENVIYANSTITGYLESIRKVKEAQQEAQEMVGLAGADTMVVNALVKLSDMIDKAVDMGKKIDIKSDDAYDRIADVTNEIKKLTNKY